MRPPRGSLCPIRSTGSTMTQEGLELLHLTMGHVDVVAGALGVARIHSLGGLVQIISHIATGCHHIAPQTQAAAVQLLLQCSQAAFHRGGAALELIELCLQGIQQMFLFQRRLLLRLKISL